ncbi:MAG: hypothetical protein LBJ83_00135 [Oscillospiraceae bacterium]|jgi:hypothetical protein|nr:hypothetical protein [Oscillospiraceae bacterium]
MVKKRISLLFVFLFMMLLCFQFVPVVNAIDVDGVLLSAEGLPTKKPTVGETFVFKVTVSVVEFGSAEQIASKSLVAKVNITNFKITKTTTKNISKVSTQGNLIIEVTINAVYLGQPAATVMPVTQQGTAQPAAQDNYGVLTSSIRFRRGDNDEIVRVAVADIPIYQERDEESKRTAKIQRPEIPHLMVLGKENSTAIVGESRKCSIVVRNLSSVEPIFNVILTASSLGVLFPKTNVIEIPQIGPKGEYVVNLDTQARPEQKAGICSINWEVSGEYQDASGSAKQILQKFETTIQVETMLPKIVMALRGFPSKKKLVDGEEMNAKIVIRNESLPASQPTTVVADSNKQTAFNGVVTITPGPGFDFAEPLNPIYLNQVLAGGVVEKQIAFAPTFPQPEAPVAGDQNQKALDGLPAEVPAMPAAVFVPTEPVTCSCTVTLTYVDIEDKEHSVSSEFVFVLEPKPQDPLAADGEGAAALPPELSSIPEEQEQKKGSTKKKWIFVGIGFVVTVGSSILVVKKIKAKRSLEADEDI